MAKWGNGCEMGTIRVYMTLVAYISNVNDHELMGTDLEHIIRDYRWYLVVGLK